MHSWCGYEDTRQQQTHTCSHVHSYKILLYIHLRYKKASFPLSNSHSGNVQMEPNKDAKPLSPKPLSPPEPFVPDYLDYPDSSPISPSFPAKRKPSPLIHQLESSDDEEANPQTKLNEAYEDKAFQQEKDDDLSWLEEIDQLRGQSYPPARKFKAGELQPRMKKSKTINKVAKKGTSAEEAIEISSSDDDYTDGKE